MRRIGDNISRRYLISVLCDNTSYGSIFYYYLLHPTIESDSTTIREESIYNCIGERLRTTLYMKWLEFYKGEEEHCQVREGQAVGRQPKKAPVNRQDCLEQWIGKEFIQYFLGILERILIKCRILLTGNIRISEIEGGKHLIGVSVA